MNISYRQMAHRRQLPAGGGGGLAPVRRQRGTQEGGGVGVRQAEGGCVCPVSLSGKDKIVGFVFRGSANLQSELL